LKIAGVTWAELIRRLKEYGFEELRTGKGSHQQFWNPTTKKVVTISVHTKKEVGKGLANRILKDAGMTQAKKGRT
jgi:mRNA interferase HicA